MGLRGPDKALVIGEGALRPGRDVMATLGAVAGNKPGCIAERSNRAGEGGLMGEVKGLRSRAGDMEKGCRSGVLLTMGEGCRM